jgi:heme/copper-type cytochrome/quinol oxidase subunit 2
VRVSAEDDRKVLAYGSVIDNATTDPVFIPVLRDNGVEPPASSTRVFDVVASQFRFDIQPGGALRANVGDTVVLRLRSSDVVHGFSMLPLVGDIRVDSSVTEVSFVVNAPGTFTYICTVATCGEGHSDMVGVMTVDP